MRTLGIMGIAANPISTLLSRSRRRLSAVVALAALVVQVAVPVLHDQGDLVVTGVHHSGGPAPELHVADWHKAPASHHDTERCSQCRVVSQARTLAAPTLAFALPVLVGQWVEFSSPLVAAPQRDHGTAPPRGPPVLA